jgi:hypothetical protein
VAPHYAKISRSSFSKERIAVNINSLQENGRGFNTPYDEMLEFSFSATFGQIKLMAISDKLGEHRLTPDLNRLSSSNEYIMAVIVRIIT